MSQEQSEQNRSGDRFQRELERTLERLRECQKSKGLKSCLQCTLVIGCTVRREYVDALYLNMNKGQGGGFAF
ncbi:MAG: hypothetical protein GXO19_05890 [Epsilonproteobacteria bacterium]|nr:hypothetical protein [Campylobacterota bacterium]NPA57246.1 hypothetical protein [Campylobacterota bacterium]